MTPSCTPLKFVTKNKTKQGEPGTDSLCYYYYIIIVPKHCPESPFYFSSTVSPTRRLSMSSPMSRLSLGASPLGHSKKAISISSSSSRPDPRLLLNMCRTLLNLRSFGFFSTRISILEMSFHCTSHQLPEHSAFSCCYFSIDSKNKSPSFEDSEAADWTATNSKRHL